MIAEEIMTIKDCAKSLKTSNSIVYQLAKQGKIQCSKAGTHRRFSKGKVKELQDRKETLAKTKNIC